MRFLILCLLSLVLINCKSIPINENRDDCKKYYNQFQVSGSFVLFNEKENKYTFYNQAQYNEAFIPASTFKICNTLIGLETGVIKDEDEIFLWDSIVRQIPAWNHSQNLHSAFKKSTVWYYQELARRIGGKQMKFWLEKMNYGNADTTGGIDQFWLKGGLRIIPKQQIDFLKRIQHTSLPVSKRSISILKKIMLEKDSTNYKVYSKTGWGEQDNKDIGWYVGFIETNNNVYYFVNCIQTNDKNNTNFAKARIKIAEEILKEISIRK